MDVLVLCTANRCRSPVAALLLARHAAELDAPVEARSAGRLPAGAPAPAEAITAARELGLDLTRHRSAQVTPREIASADLVLGVAREHVMHAISLEPERWPRTFTLHDFVRRAATVDPGPRPVSFDRWLGAIEAGRSRHDVFSTPTNDDIPDPIGCPPRVYRRVFRDLDSLTQRIAVLLAPVAP